MVTACLGCGVQRWAGFGPCPSCGLPSPEWDAETKRINIARMGAGLPPLVEDSAALEGEDRP
jgi:hypothetical protein